MSGSLTCPECGLINPPSAKNCDCGVCLVGYSISPPPNKDLIEYELREINAERAAKIAAVTSAIYCLVVLPFVLLGALAGGKEAFIVLLSYLIAPVFSYIGGYIGAAIYNWIANKYRGFTVVIASKKVS